MSKTNYSKVEELLIKGQERVKIQGWIDMTKQESTPAESNPKAFLLYSLEKGLELLPKGDRQFFKELGINRSEISKLIQDPEKLVDNDWSLIKEIRLKLKKYLSQIADTLPQLTDEDIVESERIKQQNSRFNTRDKWLPLH